MLAITIARTIAITYTPHSVSIATAIPVFSCMLTFIRICQHSKTATKHTFLVLCHTANLYEVG